MSRFVGVEDYLASFPPAVRDVLARIRTIALEAVPGGEDAIRYDIATVVADGRSIVHYAGWKQHVSVYPVPEDPALLVELAPYLAGKGTLQFALGQELPEDLLRRVVESLAARRG